MLKDGTLSLRHIYRAIAFSLLFMNVGCCCPCWGDGMLWNRMGMRAYKRCNYAQARNKFARAVAKNPCNPDYRHNLAMAIQKQGDPLAAERIFRHNLTIDAMHQPTYHALAQNLITQGRAPEAEELIVAWAETQPYVPESNIELAWVERQTGNTAGTEIALQNALRADPTNPTALAHLGQLYQETGRGDQAVAFYERSLAAKWDQPEVQSRVATMSEPKRRTRSAMMQNSNGFDTPMVAAGPTGYPLPSFDATTTAWVPSGTTAGQPTVAYQSNGVPMDSGMTPQVVNTISTSSPMVASGPTPLADPAHFSESNREMTASVPVVDPH